MITTMHVQLTPAVRGVTLPDADHLAEQLDKLCAARGIHIHLGSDLTVADRLVDLVLICATPNWATLIDGALGVLFDIVPTGAFNIAQLDVVHRGVPHVPLAERLREPVGTGIHLRTPDSPWAYSPLPIRAN